MNPVSPSFTSAPTKTSPIHRTPAPAKFGMIELGRNEFDKANNLYDAGVALAKTGNSKAATKNLMDSFAAYTVMSTRLKVVQAFTQGIEPGLKPNPKKAGELLDQLLEPKKRTVMVPGANGWEQKEGYNLSFGEDDLLADAAAALGNYDPKYRETAITILLQKSGNSYGKAKTAQKLVDMGAIDEAKNFLIAYFDSCAKQSGFDEEQLSMAKLVGGIEAKREVLINGKPEEGIQLAEIADGKKAHEMLLSLAERTQKSHIKQEILMILATGMGDISQNKEAAKRIIDTL